MPGLIIGTHSCTCGHAHHDIVSSRADFMTKATDALRRIRDELPACCQTHSIAIEPDEAESAS